MEHETMSNNNNVLPWWEITRTHWYHCHCADSAVSSRREGTLLPPIQKWSEGEGVGRRQESWNCSLQHSK